jgi:hypothetical protein
VFHSIAVQYIFETSQVVSLFALGHPRPLVVQRRVEDVVEVSCNRDDQHGMAWTPERAPTSNTALILVSVVFHREPLQIRQLKSRHFMGMTNMFFRKILLERAHVACFMRVVLHDLAVLWHDKLANLELSVGDR